MTAAPLRPRKRGRPTKSTAPQTAEQARLGIAVADAESRRDASGLVYQADKSVAAELAYYQSELEVAAAWGAYLRSTGDHTAAIKYSDSATKWAGRVADCREQDAVDLVKLAELTIKARRELEVSRRIGGGR